MITFAELKQAVRAFRRAPRLSIAAVLCIAIGMAATASVATLINLTTIKPLPFPDADRLVRIWNEEVGVNSRDEVSYRDFQDMRGHLTTLDQLEFTSRSRLIFHLPGKPGRRVEGEAVTSGYLQLLDIKPALGRLISADEYQTGEKVLLLAYQTWASEFNFADDIIGKSIKTSVQSSIGEAADSYVIVGVLPEDFYGTIEEDIPDLEFWVPVNAYLFPEIRERRSARTAFVLGKIAEGNTLAQVQAEADLLNEALAGEYAEIDDTHAFNVEPMGANWRSPFRDGGMLLSLAAILLLAVAMLNVSMVLTTRSLDRSGEFAIRAALGADRSKLMGQVVLETLLLSIAGGIIGMAVAGPMLTTFLNMSGVEVPLYFALQPDGLTLAVSFAILMGSGLAAGLVPARIGVTVGAAEVLQGGGRRMAGSRQASKLGAWLVASEIALTVVLIVAASLLTRSYLELDRTDLGYSTGNRLRTALFINPEDVEETGQLPAFVDRLEEALYEVPGVKSVALIWPTVPTLSTAIGRLNFPGMPAEDMENGLRVSNYIAGDRFFESMEIPLIAGRVFGGREGELDMRSAILSQPLAEKLGGAEAALQKIIQLNGTDYQVVGVVGDAKFAGPLEDEFHRYEMYLSYRQLPRRIISAVTEVDGDPLAYATRITRKLADVAPNSAVDWVDPVDTFVSWLYRDNALRVSLVLAFSLSALLLSAIGLYAVLAQAVVRATREIGIRKSLGATPGSILQRYLLRGMVLVTTGLSVGLLMSIGVARLMSNLLYGVEPMDFISFMATALVLILVALGASFSPAYRAARVEPMEALRYE